MDQPQQTSFPTRAVLTAAVWLGLVTGLVEGLSLLAQQRLGALPWPLAELGVSAEIVWISALLDLVAFALLAAVVLAICRVLARTQALTTSVFAMSALTFVIWLGTIGRLKQSSVLVLGLGMATVFTRWFRKHTAEVVGFWRSTVPVVALLAVLALVGIEGGARLREGMATARLPKAAAGSANVLVVVVDTLRADHLSSYGYSRATSPALDRLGREGSLFENAFAASSWTLPSHASILTGRYPHEHGLEKGGQTLDGRYPTLGEVLSARGYRTGAFSGNYFWFCRNLGFGRGFTHFEDYFQSLADMAMRTILGRDFDHLILRRLGMEDVPGRRSAADINRATLRWIDGDPTRPFFAFLNYFDVHDPYLPPPPYRNKFSQLPNPGGRIDFFVGRDFPDLTPEELRGEVDAYDGGIAYLDHQIEGLVTELHRRGLLDNTLLIVTSDHGESFGEHDLLGHRNALYREVIQVPLIIYWPGHVPVGLRIATPVSNMALPATVMGLLGYAGEQRFPGPSLAELWKHPTQAPNWLPPVSELAQMPFPEAKRNPAYSGAMMSLVNPQWHYILHQVLGPELYQWWKDPNEVHDLAKSVEGREVIPKLSEQLHAMRSRAQASTVLH